MRKGNVGVQTGAASASASASASAPFIIQLPSKQEEKANGTHVVKTPTFLLFLCCPNQIKPNATPPLLSLIYSLGVFKILCLIISLAGWLSFVLSISFMSPSLFLSLSTFCKDAAGVAGNIFAFGLFVSSVPTFRRIVRNRSTERFSGLPYIYALLNCLVTLWYGTPLVSYNNIMVTSVNSIGAAFQLVYIILFITYANKRQKVKMFGLLAVDIVLFLVIVAGSLEISDFNIRRMVVGFLSCAALISMFASPLFIINLVIRTRSVEFMPFYLSLSTFLMSASFLVYGSLNKDPFVYVPNGAGTILGISQLGLYFYYKRASAEDSREPLIVSYE